MSKETEMGVGWYRPERIKESIERIPKEREWFKGVEPVDKGRGKVIADAVAEHGWKFGAEIGVGIGETAAYLLHTCKDLYLLLVDPWVRQDPCICPNWENFGLDPHENFEKTLRVLKKVDPEVSRCQIIKTFSVQAALAIEDGALDFVFVDANHSGKAVAEDLKAWAPKVRVGGAVFGHDIGGCFPDIELAVMKFVAEMNHAHPKWLGPLKKLGVDTLYRIDVLGDR